MMYIFREYILNPYIFDNNIFWSELQKVYSEWQDFNISISKLEFDQYFLNDYKERGFPCWPRIEGVVNVFRSKLQDNQIKI